MGFGLEHCWPLRARNVYSKSYCCRRTGLPFPVSALRHHRCPVGLGEKAALLSPAPAASSLRLPRSHLSFCLFFPTEQGEPEAWKGFWAISRTQRGCFELLPNTGRLRLAKVRLRAVLLMGLTNSDNNLLPPPSGPRESLFCLWYGDTGTEPGHSRILQLWVPESQLPLASAEIGGRVLWRPGLGCLWM